MYKSIGYHTRLPDGTKVCAGSFGGSIDMETVNRLVKAHFDVIVKPSGRAVFVDRKGREVILSLTVDASKTEKGAEALKVWRIERDKQQKIAEALAESQQLEIDELMQGMAHEEIIARLKTSGSGK